MRSIRLKKQQQNYLFSSVCTSRYRLALIKLILLSFCCRSTKESPNTLIGVKNKNKNSSTHQKKQKPRTKQKETMTRKEKLVRLHLPPEQYNSKYEHFHKYTCLYTMIFFIKWLSSLPTANLRLIVAIMQVLSEASSWIFIFTHAVCICDQPASYERFSILHPP